MSKFLAVYFPEWQGYAEDNSVLKGAQTVFKELSKELEFKPIHVEEHEHLEEKKLIIGYESIFNSYHEFKELLQKEEPTHTFLLGGTCGSELAPVSYLNKKYEGDLAVLWFDGHGDLNTPASSGSKHFHGMPLRTLIGEGDQTFTDSLFSHLQPEQVILVGVRDLDDPEKEYVEEANISWLTPQSLAENPNIIVDEINRKGYKNVYLHLDLDILDPESFVHMLLHVPGGISLELLSVLIRTINGSFPIVGSSLLEFVQRGEGGTNEVKELVDLLLEQVKTSK